RQRTAPAPTPESDDKTAGSTVYDHPDLEKRYVRTLNDGDKEAILLLQGVNCAACVWLIEQFVGRLPGVRSVDMNYTTRQARIRWNGEHLGLSAILAQIESLGYRAMPTIPGAERALLDAERRRMLRRLGVAAALGMQVMVLAVALYTGEWWGIEPRFDGFFKSLSLFLTLPVLAYSGTPFFTAAWRDLRFRRLGMDIPISLGLTAAFGASVWATVNGGEVYFDSVVMFVFFLLVARYVELMARVRASDAVQSGGSLIPDRATRLEAGGSGVADVPAVSLKQGDRILVRPGEVVPADGDVVAGSSTVDESLLTGESCPVRRDVGAMVVAGAINLEQPLTVLVTATGEDTVVSGIRHLLKEAQFTKPMMIRQVDRVARWFVAGVLLVAAVVATGWWLVDPSQALAATIAVLIVSCPCALALATPAVTAAAVGAALKRGVLVVNSRAMETLTRTTRYFFDKTGTLTQGKFELATVDPLMELSAQECLAIGAALEQYAQHPLAAAFTDYTRNGVPQVDSPEVVTGRGIAGSIGGRPYVIGNREFVAERIGMPLSVLDTGCVNPGESVVFLARESDVLAAFTFRDSIRERAGDVLQTIKTNGNAIEMLTGDRSAVAAKVGRQLGISDIHADLAPDEKLALVQQANRNGDVTVMVGDGVNDAPVIGGAHVSIALGNHVDLTTTAADVVVLNRDLGGIEYLLDLSRRVVRIVRQNFVWAISYNIIAIPAAALSMVPPWLAAIGMSASSVVVVLNALRVR
ncbi:MAG: cation-translocating P-type ATPase, partial [Gammaproteobacteria bacterium]|nr:cation-translocating P-type ATPase [Gammaproteobacteria bacterium]